MLNIVCCLVVGFGLGSEIDLVFGWLVVGTRHVFVGLLFWVVTFSSHVTRCV